jgi:flagellar hook-associated protein 3 FlgL
MIDASSNATLGLMSTQSARLRERMDLLTRQSSDGRIGSQYGDLGLGGAGRSIDLRAAMARQTAYAANATAVLDRTTVMQSTLTRLSAIASDFRAAAISVNGLSAEAVTAVAGKARQALGEVASLLNAQHMGDYIFGGSDTATPPLPDADTILAASPVADIQAAMGGLASGTAATVLATTLALAQGTAPGATVFSAFLEDPATGGGEAPRMVAVDDGEQVAYGIAANRNAFAVSRGETTGAWSRDLLRGLSMLAGLTPDKIQAGADFDQVMKTIGGIFDSASGALGVEQGSLGLAEARIAAGKTRQEELRSVLEGQRGAVEEVDLARTLTEMQDVQTRLQASYKAISVVSQLSLVNFL